MNEFEKLKNMIISTINACKSQETTQYTKYFESGIYLLYVDNFDEDNICPIYIGQTTNFQERYEQHITSLIELDQMTKEEYILRLIENNFEGRYLYNKLFTYLINHNCTIDNVHMIVLEFVESYELREKEAYYINLFESSIYGFNQLNSIIFLLEKKEGYITGSFLPLKEYKDLLEKDIDNYFKYPEAYYRNFNYWLLCRTININTIKNYIGTKHYDKLKIIYKEIMELMPKTDECGNIIYDNKEEYLGNINSLNNNIYNEMNNIVDNIMCDIEKNYLNNEDIKNEKTIISIRQRIFEILYEDKILYPTIFEKVSPSYSLYKHSFKLISNEKIKKKYKIEIKKLSKYANDYLTYCLLIKNSSSYYNFPLDKAFINIRNEIINKIIPSRGYEKYSIGKSFTSPLNYVRDIKQECKVVVGFNGDFEINLEIGYYFNSFPIYLGVILNGKEYEFFFKNSYEFQIKIKSIYLTTINEKVYNSGILEKISYSDFDNMFEKIFHNYDSIINVYILGSTNLQKDDVNNIFKRNYDMKKIKIEKLPKKEQKIVKHGCFKDIEKN